MRRHALAVLATATVALVAAIGPIGPSQALTGGPDGAGYTFADSDEPDGPAGGPFTSIAPADGGTGVDIGNHCSECTTAFDLPFPVRFYDLTTTAVDISSNGYLEIPTSPIPAEINVYRYPLRTSGRGNGVFARTSGAPGERTLTLEWRGVVAGQPKVHEQFQLVLHEDSERIDMNFLDVNPPSDDSRIADTSLYGGVGDRYLRYGDFVRDDLAIRWERPISGAPTRVAVSRSPAAEVFYAQPLTLEAKVTAVERRASSPTGSVTFFDGDEVLGTAPVNVRGIARLRLAEPTPSYEGENVVARYDGDADHRLSYSPTMSFSIEPARTTTSLEVPRNGTVRRGGPGLTARAALAKPSRGTLDGDVIWYVDDSYLAETPLVDGRATLPSRALPLGDHVVQAMFDGQVFYLENSLSDSVPITVIRSGS